MEYNRIKTVEDLLRRYNLDGIEKDRKRIAIAEGQITKTDGILQEFVDVTTDDLEQIKDQLDGNVTSWFYNYVPTLSNAPASSWTTDDDKKEHLGDLFYNQDTGKVYKFVIGTESSNLYDKNTAAEFGPTTPSMYGRAISVADSYIYSPVNSSLRLTYIPCEHNTKYKIKKGIGNRFDVATVTDFTLVSWYYPCNQAYNYEGETEIELTTGNNDNYICIGYQTSAQETMDDIRASIEIYSEYDTETYMWKEITNDIGAQALAIANAAQDTADHKRRVFVSEPTTPYDTGDIWWNDTNHELYRCVTSRASGNFQSSDWTNNLKYTDDTYAQAVESTMISSYATKTDLSTTAKSINASVKALKVTTDAKNTIWETQPTVPYTEGDIWIKTVGSTQEVYNCIQTRTTGSYTASDWELDADLTEYVSEAGIQIFQDAINMEVKKKVGDNEIISKINQTSEQISIDANKINLNGYISANGQFIIDSNSSLTLIGGSNTAKFTIKQDTDNTKEVYLTPNALYMVDPAHYTSARIVNGNIPNILLSNTNTGKSSGMGVGSIDCSDSINKLYAHLDSSELNFESGVNRDRTLTMDVDTGTIETIGLIQSQNGICQGSLEELKENFEPLKSGLEIIKDIDIYKYNYKSENNAKKHIGLVIGDNYNYSKEVTNDKNEAIDIYSFVSVCCKAIQEQQKEIEELKTRLEELENGKIR